MQVQEVCNNVPRKQCRKVAKTVQSKQCAEVPVKKCRWVLKEFNHQEQKQTCRNVVKNECQKVPRQISRKVSRNVPRQKCITVPSTECKNVEVTKRTESFIFNADVLFATVCPRIMITYTMDLLDTQLVIYI